MKSIPTSEFCPACRATKQPNRLNKNLLGDDFFCVNPANGRILHSFPTFEEVQSYDPDLAYLEAQGEEEPAEPPPTPEPVNAPVLEAPKAKFEPVKEAPEPPSKALDPVPVPTPKVEAAPVAEVKKPAPAPAIEIPSLVKQPSAPFVPPAARKLPGGDLIMTVRVPEQFVSFLAQEAITSSDGKETIEQYFQRMVEYGMDARWFF